MQESFVHFLWRTRRFEGRHLFTCEGLPLSILHPGEYNAHHAGPDFFNARLRIGDTEWAGNVEMHVRASDWYQHGHQTDTAYHNVVLHVVWEADQPVLRPDGTAIPTLCLAPLAAPDLLRHYERLLHQTSWIACADQWEQVPSIIVRNWLDRMLVERLEQKTQRIEHLLHVSGQHWEAAFYHALAASFGLSVNTAPFEALARSIPLSLLARHRSDLRQIEALLFGQAGLLDGPFQEQYPAQLAREYRFLQHKYGLVPLPPGQWKFLRMRPANFPTVRIAQFARLVHQSQHLFSQVLEASEAREVEHLFSVEADGYWQLHYRFDQPSVKRNKALGRDFIHLLMINTIIPMLFYYGRSREMPQYERKALRWLEALPPEANTILQGWEKMGMTARQAYESQALLHLKKQYCDQKRCLECQIGCFLLK